jgi:putative GTP pyrophosphokinase
MTNQKINTDEVLSEFDALKPKLIDLCERTKDLLEEAIEASGLKIQGITWRVKDRNKLKRKYESSDKQYCCLSDITDVAGLRIITYLARDVDVAASIVRREFDLDEKNSIDKRKSDHPEKLGYQSLHYICRYKPQRLSLFEYSKYSGLKFELQTRSLLQHAWAELQHGAYDVGENIPDDIKTRFSCLSGLLQLADREFSSVIDDQIKYARSAAVMVETRVDALSEVRLDALSLGAFVEKSTEAKELDARLGVILGATIETAIEPNVVDIYSKAANAAGLITLNDLTIAIDKYGKAQDVFERNLAARWPKAEHKALPAGICVYRASLFTMAIKGPEVLDQFLNTISAQRNTPDFAETTVAAAHEALKSLPN